MLAVIGSFDLFLAGLVALLLHSVNYWSVVLVDSGAGCVRRGYVWFVKLALGHSVYFRSGLFV